MLAERVGFESARKRRYNNLQSTDGTVSTWKAVVVYTK